MTRLHLVLPAVLLTLVVPPATAQTWTGAAGDFNWTDSNNWNPMTVPNSPTADVTFGNAGAGQVTIYFNSVQANSLNFTGVGTGSYGLFSTAGLTLSGLTAINYLNLSGNDSGTQLINLAPNSGGNLVSAAGGPLTITNNVGYTASPGLVIGGNTVIGTPPGGGPVVFAGFGTTEMSGSFANGIYHVGGLTKTGAGQLIIDGDGTKLQGNLTLNGGNLTLDYTHNTASKLGGGGLNRLYLSGGSLTLLTNSTAITDAVGGNGTTLSANHTEVSASATVAGTNVTLNLGAISRAAGATVNFYNGSQAGAIFSLPTSTGNTNGLLGTGPAYATANGGPTWATNSGGFVVGLPDSSYGSNTYTPGTNTDYVGPFHYLQANTTTNSIRFNVSGSNELDLLGASLTVQSGGILMTPFSGPMIIQSYFYGGEMITTPGGTGELLVHQYNYFGNALTINANIVTSGGLTKTGGGQLILGGTNTGLTGPINVNLGSLTVTQTAAVNSASTINLGDYTYFTCDLGNYVNGTVSTNIRMGNGQPVFSTGRSTNSTVTLSGVISSVTGQSSGASFIGGDITSGMNLTGNNTFLGDVFAEEGSLGINSNASLGNAANRLILAVGSSTAGGLVFLNGGINLARPVQVVGGVYYPTRIVSNGSDVNTISGVISDFDPAFYGGGRVYKAGFGTLILSGTNTYAGGTQIDAGTLSIAADANLGAALTSVSINTGATLAVSSGFSTARPLLIGPTSTTAPTGPANIAVAAGQTFTPTGGISDNFGAGTLSLTGPGTVVLNTPNSYSGGTVVQQGTLQVAMDSALGAPLGQITINPPGSLTYTGSTTTSRTFSINSGTLKVAAGQTLTLNGATVAGGFLVGSFATTAGASTTFVGNTTRPSTTLALNGADSLMNFSQGGRLTVAAAQTVSLTGLTNQGSGAITVGAASAVNVSDFQSYGTLTINPATVTENYSQTTLMTNTGMSQLYFNGGSRTFVGTPATAVFPNNWPDVSLRGTPTFVAGIDLHGQNAVVAGGLFVDNGYVEDTTNNGQGTAAMIADFGSLVKGAGYFQNTVQTINGGKFQAGNSPGAATFGKFVLGPGGVSSYVFAIDDATGAAGPSPDALGHVSGWGLVKVGAPPVTHGGLNTRGDFVWTATPADKLTVSLQTLLNPTTVGVDIAGPMDHFDPSRSYSWPAVEWTGNYAGPADSVVLDAATAFETSGFANAVAGGFGWQLDTAGHSLSLVYSPSAVPEPGTLVLTTIVGLAGAIRRRWGRSATAAT